MKMIEEDDYFCVMIFQRREDGVDIPRSSQCVFQDCAKLSQIRPKIGLYNTLAREVNGRVYVSVSPRDMKNSQKNLLLRLIKTFYELKQTNNIIRQVYSSLMMSPLKEKKRFMVDIDDITKFNEVQLKLLKYGIDYNDMITVDTKNGSHLIVPPFDVRILNGIEGVELKKDGMTDIEYVNIIGERK